MWTKGLLADQVMLKIAGGEPSPALEVDREDVLSYLDAAVGYAIDQYIKEERQQTYYEKRFLGKSQNTSPNISEIFTTTIQEMPVLDESRDAYYVELSKGVLLLADGVGVGEVGPVQGDKVYVRTGGRTTTAGMPNIGSVTFYWLELMDDNTQRIYFKNLGRPVCKVLMRITQDVRMLDLDDPLYIPAAVQPAVIDLCVKFFLEERAIQADETLDQDDPGLRGGSPPRPAAQPKTS